MRITSAAPLVMVVEDSATNLHFMERDLKEAGCRVVSAVHGEEAWEILQNSEEQVSVIVLDRVMPELDGVALTKRIKADPQLSEIPIIMQTAAKKKEEIVEGIEAGVYYYLTKPYDRVVLLSIISSACRSFEDLSRLRQELGDIKGVLDLFETFKFRVKTLDDAKRLAPMLASIFPNPDQTVLGISELLINAVEHGNLGVTYEDKSRLLKEDRWAEEIDRRIQLPEYRDRFVRVELSQCSKELTLWIHDEGDGFDWREYLVFSPDRATHNHGRGIAMSKSLSFDTLQYIGRGNEVICKVFLTKDHRSTHI